jgi:hypothetical protein
MDPLTSAVCTLNEVREMCGEMPEAQRRRLRGLAGKRVAPRLEIFIRVNGWSRLFRNPPAQVP